uniref:Odorant binding protein Obp57 n=1 Tax=Anopheles merus TaxID=30066 RepID=A0A8F5SNF1_ANOME|nr:odorant binding protein Obp57 [Anopheles merus]QXO35797.1 odorant binding protein Obp57 [Anopheles merus]
MGKVLILFVGALVVASVAAGRFERSVFAPRMKRGATMRCCNDGFEKSEVHAKFAEVRTACMEELGLGETTHEELIKNREHLNCITECIAKKEGIADEGGALLHTDLAKVVLEHMSTIEWKVPLAEGFIQQCFDEVELTDGAFVPSDEAKCNPEGFDFVFCLWRQFTLACPEEFRDDSEKCVELRDKLTNKEDVSDLHDDIEAAE